jgi:hypothetical protein
MIWGAFMFMSVLGVCGCVWVYVWVWVGVYVFSEGGGSLELGCECVFGLACVFLNQSGPTPLPS